MQQMLRRLEEAVERMQSSQAQEEQKLEIGALLHRMSGSSFRDEVYQ
jgi:hypothetical protein